MMMIVFLGIFAAAIWLFILLGKVISKIAEHRLNRSIIVWLDAAYDRWLYKNPIYRDDFSEDICTDEGDNEDEGLSTSNSNNDRGSGYANWSQGARTSVLIAIFMIGCNLLIHYGSLSELIIGSLIGIGVSALQGSVFNRNFLQKFATGALAAPILLIIIRNYIDTYRMGLLIFSLSAVKLYLTQWIGVLFYYLICRSLEHHHNPKNIAVLWVFVVFIIAIL